MRDPRTFEQRWKWITSYMVVLNGFTHYFLMMMDKVKDDNVHFMSVKVDPLYITLRYNEEQLRELSDFDIIHLLMHEIHHVILHHCTTRRYDDPFNDAVLSEAQDLAVNCLIPDYKDKNGTSIAPMPCNESGIPMGVFPVDYDYPNNLSADQYFNMLKNDIKSIMQEQNNSISLSISMEGGEGKGDSDDTEEGEGNSEEDETSKKPSSKRKLSEKTKKAIQKLIDDINNNNPHLLDDHTGWEESNIVDEMIRNKIQSAMSQKKVWGSVPGNVQSVIEAAQEHKVSWERYLKYHIGNLISPNYERTITKPDKRFGYPYLGKKRVYSDKKLVAIDTSGSISDENLTQFLAEMNKLVELMPVDLVLFDTDIQLGPISFHRKHISFDFKGRGGTNFQPVFNLAVERKYQSVIILTDGCAPAIEYPEGVKDVLWVLTDKDYDPPVDWGERVHIEE